MQEGKILIVDDNNDVLLALNLLLKPYVEKIKVTTSPEKIYEYMDNFSPDVIILDMNYRRESSSGEEGFEHLSRILSKDSNAVVILMTAYSDTDKAVKAIHAGAIDFIPKPWEKDKLLVTISAALRLRKSRSEVVELKEKLDTIISSNDNVELIGESAVMKDVLKNIKAIASTTANVLLLGENGTGKDVIAKAIHQYSQRCDKAFVNVDLGAIPETLFESELFGYEKGAFTDAKKDKAGRFETATGGTLFLDEIANLSSAMQSRLLTVLEKRQISRLGSTKTKDIDVRLISATNADLYDMIENDNFRQDLFYRINTIEIAIPPLRERGQDIILLAEHFMQKFGKKYKKGVSKIDKEAKQKLLKYSWPGNVRELQHSVERAVILSQGDTLEANDFILRQVKKAAKTQEIFNLAQLEKDAIQKAIDVSGGNLNKAAELLGITRYTLYRKIEKL